jgi:hypothetical protein
MAGRNENSFTESLANFFTPNDGYSYSGGTLREDTPEGRGLGAAYTGGSYKTNYGQFGQADSASTGTNYQNITSGGEARDTGPGYTPPKRIDPPPEAKNTGPMYTNPLIMGTIGAFSGGLPGLLLGAGRAKIRGGMYNVPQIDNTQGDDPTLVSGKAGKYSGELKKRVPDSFTTEEIKQQLENDRRGIETENRIEGSFYKKDKNGNVDDSKLFKLNRFGSSYEVDGYGHPNYGNSKQNRLDMEAGSDGSGGIAMVRRAAPITQATVPTDGLPAASAMSQEAAAGQFMPIPNPDYDSTDPLSPRYIINPTYDQLVEYKKSVTGMARGGEVESALGGNEKDLINDAEKAIRGELDETRAAIILAQYVQQYGEDALRDLVNSVRTGSAQETRDRFARGDNGYVNGNGDGSGTDDKVPAKLKEGNSEQDVLLAEGEFVLRKDAYEALKDAGVNVDKVNDAGSNAAKELNKMMTA